jgi:hypothetical protein
LVVVVAAAAAAAAAVAVEGELAIINAAREASATTHIGKRRASVCIDVAAVVTQLPSPSPPHTQI